MLIVVHHHRTLVALLAALSVGIACASDWQFAGSAKQGNDETFAFFDADSLSRPTKDVVRVWVKSIRIRDFDRYYKAHEKAVVDKSARKIVTGYVPPFLLLPSVNTSYDAKELRDAAAQMTGDEVMANAPDIRPVSKIYFEIDCTGKRIKTLDVTLYNDKGEPKYGTGRPSGDYQFIPPDTNGQWLSLLACPAK